MRILAVGDVVGTSGCNCLREKLPKLKKEKRIDLCIVNGENSSDGNGITPASAEHIFVSGADVITTGNHAYRRREMYSYFDDNEFVLRPANFSKNNPGHGVCTVDMGRCSVCVINLMGNMYMGDSLENPFDVIDKLIQETEDKIIFVDFHAEATSEKRAMAFYLDGRVTGLFGTHTHVQTADECVLKGGTGYITDLGMVGTIDSVLGVKPEIVIDKFKYSMPARFDFLQGESMLCGCIFEIDEKTGKTVSIERVCV